jgi:HAE1 family hydrophobic/amphiphilic exporter-1
VTLAGGREREIRIWIDPLRLGGYGLAVDDVLGALQREHVELPGGRLETDEREWALRTEGKLTSAAQFGAVVVAEQGGSVIHLRDVANVEDGMAEERTISRLGDRRGVALQIRRQSGENTVAVVDAVAESSRPCARTCRPAMRCWWRATPPASSAARFETSPLRCSSARCSRR